MIIIEATKQAMDMRGEKQSDDIIREQCKRMILCAGPFEREKTLVWKTQSQTKRASSADKWTFVIRNNRTIEMLKNEDKAFK